MTTKSLTLSKEEYLGVKQGMVLKGVSAFCVLLSHTIPRSGLCNSGVVNSFISTFGFLAVAVFFFLSGYGITFQHNERKEQYLRNFLKTRVLSTYLLSAFFVAVYLLFRLLLKETVSCFDVVLSFLFGRTIISGGWFLQVIMLFYIFWYLTARFIHKEQTQFMALCGLVLLYMIIGLRLVSRLWVEGSLCFLLGVYWARNKNEIDKWLFEERKWYRLAILVSFFVFCATYLFGVKTFIAGTIGEVVIYIARCIAMPLFVFLLLILNIRCGEFLNCKILRFLGKYSLEIYVLQGIVIRIFKEGSLRIDNGLVYTICVIFGTIFLSVAMHPIIKMITGIPLKYVQKG